MYICIIMISIYFIVVVEILYYFYFLKNTEYSSSVVRACVRMSLSLSPCLSVQKELPRRAPQNEIRKEGGGRKEEGGRSWFNVQRSTFNIRSMAGVVVVSNFALFELKHPPPRPLAWQSQKLFESVSGWQHQTQPGRTCWRRPPTFSNPPPA